MHTCNIHTFVKQWTHRFYAFSHIKTSYIVILHTHPNTQKTKTHAHANLSLLVLYRNKFYLTNVFDKLCQRMQSFGIKSHLLSCPPNNNMMPVSFSCGCIAFAPTRTVEIREDNPKLPEIVLLAEVIRDHAPSLYTEKVTNDELIGRW